MTDHQLPADDSDDLDALLSANTDAGDVSLRASLRQRSTTAFVRRRRRRRVVRTMSLAACYLLGVVTFYAWQQVSASPASVNTDTNIAGSTTDKPRDRALRDNETPQGQTTTRPQSPDQAVAAVAAPRALLAPPTKPVPKSQFDRLRELGDHHLLADRNPEQALRCYRVALRYATSDEFTAASREGTWLLRAICLDTKQEKDHASNKS